MRRVVLLFILSGLSLTATARAIELVGGSEADRQALLAVSEIWVDAYLSGDLDALMSIMHEDALIMPHNVPTTRGFAAVRDYFEGRVGRPGVDFDDNLEEIRINGDWAFVRGSFRVAVTPPGADEPAFVHNGRYLVLYERTGDGWKMLRDMDNADPVAD